MVSTRPDISYAVTKVAKFAKNPGPLHVQALQRIFRYLSGSTSLCLVFSPTAIDEASLQAFCDADWAGKHSENSLSTSGFIFTLARGPISWSSKKQTSTALSSTESEYIAQSHAIQELIWIQLFLSELGLAKMYSTPTPIFADNQGAIALASNHQYHARSRHIHVRYHFTRQAVDSGICKFIYVPTTKQAADGFTKPLGKIAFARFRTMIGQTSEITP
jgi:hypothetical protein